MANISTATFAASSDMSEWRNEASLFNAISDSAAWPFVRTCMVVLAVSGCTSERPPQGEPDHVIEARERKAEEANLKKLHRETIDSLAKRTNADREWDSFLTDDSLKTPAFTADFQKAFETRIGKSLLVVGHLQDIIKTSAGYTIICTYTPWNAERWAESQMIFSLQVSAEQYSTLVEQMTISSNLDPSFREIALVLVARRQQAIVRRDLQAFVEVEEGIIESRQLEAEVQEGNFETILRIGGECVDFEYLGDYEP